MRFVASCSSKCKSFNLIVLTNHSFLFLLCNTQTHRFFRCISKAREARLKKLQIYQEKKYGKPKDEPHLKPSSTPEQAPEATTNVTEPEATPLDQRPEDVTTTTTEHNTSESSGDNGEGPHDATATNSTADPVELPKSPMSILSEATQPETIQPPRKLEKGEDNTDDEAKVTDGQPTPCGGLLCGCI